jgi:hypothetical protein
MTLPDKVDYLLNKTDCIYPEIMTILMEEFKLDKKEAQKAVDDYHRKRLHGITSVDQLPPVPPGNSRCQFCFDFSPSKNWKEDHCPKCGRKYDVILAIDSEVEG